MDMDSTINLTYQHRYIRVYTHIVMYSNRLSCAKASKRVYASRLRSPAQSIQEVTSSHKKRGAICNARAVACRSGMSGPVRGGPALPTFLTHFPSQNCFSIDRELTIRGLTSTCQASAHTVFGKQRPVRAHANLVFAPSVGSQFVV
jgi:hypothetical protein